MKRRWWAWVGAAVLAIGCAIVAIAALKRDTYGFLERYHPRHAGVSELGLPATASSKAVLLIYPEKDADQVLAAMRAELSPALGFKAEDIGSVSEGSRSWEFSRVSTDDDCYFADGEQGKASQYWYEDDGVLVAREPCCVVLIHEPESWLDHTLGSVRRFLHPSP